MQDFGHCGDQYGASLRGAGAGTCPTESYYAVIAAWCRAPALGYARQPWLRQSAVREEEIAFACSAQAHFSGPEVRVVAQGRSFEVQGRSGVMVHSSSVKLRSGAAPGLRMKAEQQAAKTATASYKSRAECE